MYDSLLLGFMYDYSRSLNFYEVIVNAPQLNELSALQYTFYLRKQEFICINMYIYTQCI